MHERRQRVASRRLCIGYTTGSFKGTPRGRGGSYPWVVDLGKASLTVPERTRLRDSSDARHGVERGGYSINDFQKVVKPIVLKSTCPRSNVQTARSTQPTQPIAQFLLRCPPQCSGCVNRAGREPDTTHHASLPLTLSAPCTCAPRTLPARRTI